MGNFLNPSKAGGPLFDPVRDKITGKQGIGALDLRNTVKPGGPLYDPVRDAILKKGGVDTSQPGAYSQNYQTDPQTGKLIPMPDMNRGPQGVGGMPYTSPSWTPAQNVRNTGMQQLGQTGGNMTPAPQTGGGMPLPQQTPVQGATSDQGNNMVNLPQQVAGDPTQQAALAMLLSSAKNGARQMPMQQQPRPYVVRQPGYYQ